MGGLGLTDADVEADGFKAGAALHRGVCVVGERAVLGDKGGTIAEPEGAEGGEDHKGECVAEDPLEER